MRIDQGSIELDDILSDMQPPDETPAKNGAVKTTKQTLQSKRQAHKETKESGAAIKVQQPKIAGNTS